MTKPIVYFLCRGNSCRSQIAEGWARQLGGGAIDEMSTVRVLRRMDSTLVPLQQCRKQA